MPDESVFSFKELRLQDSEMANNRSARILLCLCIDASTSMQLSGAIRQINVGITNFLKRINGNSLARDATEVCIVTFGNDARVLCPFGSAETVLQTLTRTPIAANASETRLGAGVQLALDEIKTYRQRLSLVNNNSYTPWLIIISDGDSTEGESVVKAASDRVQSLLRTFRLRTMCLTMGTGSRNLYDFSLDHQVDRLENLSVSRFFESLSRNVSQASRKAIEYGGLEAPTDWK